MKIEHCLVCGKEIPILDELKDYAFILCKICGEKHGKMIEEMWDKDENRKS